MTTIIYLPDNSAADYVANNKKMAQKDNKNMSQKDNKNKAQKDNKNMAQKDNKNMAQKHNKQMAQKAGAKNKPIKKSKKESNYVDIGWDSDLPGMDQVCRSIYCRMSKPHFRHACLDNLYDSKSGVVSD